MYLLALKIGCSVEELKMKVFEKFDTQELSVNEFESLRLKQEPKKLVHAVGYNMHPDDTPAAIMIEMMLEYMVILQSRKKTDEQMIAELASDYDDLFFQVMSALGSGDMKKYKDLITHNPEFLDSFIKKVAENEEKED